MKRTKTQKGITLVALIITIVVLLILAAVAIGTVRDSDIIGHAQNAAAEYENKQQEEQTILDAIEKELNNYNNKDDDNDKNDLEELTKYLLGNDGEGRDLSEIYDANLGFKQDPRDTKSDIYTKLKVTHAEFESMESELIAQMYVRCDRSIYKIRYSIKIIDQNTIEGRTIKDSLEFVKTLEGNLGKYVTYANNTWIVLTDNASGVELISANALGSINFESSTFEEARTKYNDVIESLVTKCKEETGITTNIRSVGSFITEEEKLSDNNTVVFSDLKTFSPRVEYSEFAKFEGGINGFRKDNLDYETDYNKMLELGILTADNGVPYWLASRFVYEHKDAVRSYVNFEVRYISSGTFLEQNFCSVEERAYSSIANGCDSEDYRAVRPIVMLNPGILDKATQTGLIDDPIILN